MNKSQVHSHSRNHSWPLSPVQRQFWVLSKLHPDSATYNLPCLLSIRGPLNVSALRRSFEEHLQRHDVFRIVIEEHDGIPSQYLLPSVELDFNEVDLRHFAPGERAAQLQDLIEDEVKHHFDLTTPPLSRIGLYRLNDQEWQLLLVEHHLIIDLRSCSILEEELPELYDAFISNRPHRLPPITCQFSDYTKWQLEWEKSERATEMIAAWKSLFERKIHPSSIPFDHPGLSRTSIKGGEVFFEVPEEIYNRILQFSFEQVLPERYAKASVTSTLLAGFALLLARQSGLPDQVIGLAYGNRVEPGQLDFHGCAVNTLPTPLDVSEDGSFSDLARQAQTVTWQMRELQQIPFKNLVEALKLERNQTDNPLFQVGMEILLPLSFQLAGIEIEALPVVNHGAKVNLNLVFQGWEDRIHGYLEYNSELFDPKRAQWMVDEYIQILDEGTSHPIVPLHKLSTLSDDERHFQLENLGRGKQIDSAFMSLPEWIANHAKSTPAANALCFRDCEITYQSLWEYSQIVAEALVKAGIRKGDLVGLCCNRSPEMIYGLLGIHLVGAAYLPLDPEYPAERLAFMVEDSGAGWILARTALTGNLPHTAAQIIDLDEILAQDIRDVDGLKLPQLQPEDRAYLIYTSGSTGKPKGVELLHDGLSVLANAQLERFGTGPDSRVLQFASLNFDASIWEILMAFAAGGTLCLGTREDMLPGSDLVRTLQYQRISIVTLPPSILMALPATPLPDLKTIVVAGEPCPASLVRQWSPGRTFYNAYGPTETTVCATIGECQDDGEKPSIGTPICGTYIRLLDERLRLVPVGAIGELCVGGASLAKGYLNRQDLTAEKFIIDPTSKEQNVRLYRTGDLARWRMDGSIELIGRRDNQVKIRGFRVELGEVESLLSEHPNVRQAVVVPQAEDDGMTDQLVAYFVAEKGFALHANELRSYLARRMPVSTIPSVFLQIESIPLTPNDKVDRQALANQTVVKPMPPLTDWDQPLNEAERRIASIWKQTLHLDSVSPHVNFFDAGGHSLSLMTVRSKLETEFARTLDAIVMFQYPTIAELARYLTEGNAEVDDTESPERAVIRQQHVSFAQRRKQARLQHRKENQPKD